MSSLSELTNKLEDALLLAKEVASRSLKTGTLDVLNTGHVYPPSDMQTLPHNDDSDFLTIRFAVADDHPNADQFRIGIRWSAEKVRQKADLGLVNEIIQWVRESLEGAYPTPWSVAFPENGYHWITSDGVRFFAFEIVAEAAATRIVSIVNACSSYTDKELQKADTLHLWCVEDVPGNDICVMANGQVFVRAGHVGKPANGREIASARRLARCMNALGKQTSDGLPSSGDGRF